VVETVVLETILGKLSKTVGAKNDHTSLAGLDPATRFYILWRYTYKAADLDAGEAIIFANGTHVELDGLHGLSQGSRPLIEKKKGKYRLLDYAERGDDAKLGMPSEDKQSAPLIDGLHRLLWLMERHPSGIPEFLREARPNIEQMRLVAQALAGPALKGGELGEVATGSELSALTKLTANWRSVVEDAAGPAEGPLFRATRRQGQEKP
jgi:putative DNA methylase